MKKLVIGILAHVDSGKTTLSEGMLYTSGGIRKMGRVDNGDAFLDTNQLEKARGITIFSKQAIMKLEESEITLLDTPGHVDFSAEMERTLQVLDYAILVINGADGVQAHTVTLWRLLTRYKIPAFIFINKMDQSGISKNDLLIELKNKLDERFVDFTNTEDEEFYENVAMCDENTLNIFLENSRLEDNHIVRLVKNRKVFPCYFGSALKLEGIEELLQGLEKYTLEKIYPSEFGAKIYKIARDEQGNRLTYMKVTGGSIKIKDLLTNGKTKIEKEQDNIWEEKVNQIRVYSGEKYDIKNEVLAGEVCAVTGLSKTYAGEGLGIEIASETPMLEPVLTYGICLPDDVDVAVILPKLKQLEEEDPALHIVWNSTTNEIQAQIMGQVQIEILQSLIKERFDVDVTFDTGKIVYKETISNIVEGVGHFEPLRHYAEVHVLLESGETGSGLQFETNCSEDILDRNWQNLILTHMKEREHLGVLTGSGVTDMKITLVAGKAHSKHTEGGDFRQATYRSIRQGLMEAESILLEPYYEYTLEVPQEMVGRAMTDIDRMYGTFEITKADEDSNVLKGTVPVICMQDYQQEVISYTKGQGRLICNLLGYLPCHNFEEVIESIGYNVLRDTENPVDSVFCAHGAGFNVGWDKVKEYMHVESVLKEAREYEDISMVNVSASEELWIGEDEVEAILSRTFDANRRKDDYDRKRAMRTKIRDTATSYSGSKIYKAEAQKEKYLLVDGYNIIFAWDELKELAKDNLDSARGKLLDILCAYQPIKGVNIIAVFDAYKVKGQDTKYMDYQNIHVVYTKEAETADQYIEKFAHSNNEKYAITVATSDGLEQLIIRGAGCSIMSARELKLEIDRDEQEFAETYLNKKQDDFDKGNDMF